MKKILVVVDMQNDFITGALRNEDGIAIVPYVRSKIETAKKAGETIIFTRDTHDDDYMETEEGTNLPVPHCKKGTEGWEILKELDADTNADLIINKETFGSTGLAEYMQKHKDEIGEVEFIGVCTDICVISNVLITKAVLPNKKIYVDAKGCAGVTKQAHDTALSAMKACHIKIENEL